MKKDCEDKSKHGLYCRLFHHPKYRDRERQGFFGHLFHSHNHLSKSQGEAAEINYWMGEMMNFH